MLIKNLDRSSLPLLARAVLATLLVLGGLLLISDPFTLVFFLSYAAVGALLVVRRPTNVVGWVILVIAFFGFIATTTPTDLDRPALEAGRASTRDFVLAWLSAWGGNASFFGYFALTVLLPQGRLPAGRWRVPAVALLGLGAVL